MVLAATLAACAPLLETTAEFDRERVFRGETLSGHVALTERCVADGLAEAHAGAELGAAELLLLVGSGLGRSLATGVFDTAVNFLRRLEDRTRSLTIATLPFSSDANFYDTDFVNGAAMLRPKGCLVFARFSGGSRQMAEAPGAWRRMAFDLFPNRPVGHDAIDLLIEVRVSEIAARDDNGDLTAFALIFEPEMVGYYRAGSRLTRGGAANVGFNFKLEGYFLRGQGGSARLGVDTIVEGVFVFSDLTLGGSYHARRGLAGAEFEPLQAPHVENTPFLPPPPQIVVDGERLSSRVPIRIHTQVGEFSGGSAVVASLIAAVEAQRSEAIASTSRAVDRRIGADEVVRPEGTR